MSFDFTATTRKEVLAKVHADLEAYYSNTNERRVASEWNVEEIKNYVKSLSFEHPNEINQVLDQVINGLEQYAVHVPHPNYHGLFNPRPNFASIIADLITATYNPQLAAWSHSPFANEIEQHVINEFGKRIGFEKAMDGTFCTGGAEANHTALLCALNHAFPNFNELGVSGIDLPPVIYCSFESHHSVEKAAKMSGLGTKSVKYIQLNDQLQMDVDALRVQIEEDIKNGLRPLMIVGTAGTTGAGAIDDLNDLHLLSRKYNTWFHVDGAYGGAIAVSEKYRSFVSGIEHADSLTLDLHKWFSVPMASSLFMTSNRSILHQSFSIKTAYMPDEIEAQQTIDPYVHSVQWSRRFIGLKIYLPLAVHGWEGYEQVINDQVDLANQMRKLLRDKGWQVVNSSDLPVICFNRGEYRADEMKHIVDAIANSGKAWISTYPINGVTTARFCITNYNTTDVELGALLDLLEEYKI